MKIFGVLRFLWFRGGRYIAVANVSKAEKMAIKNRIKIARAIRVKNRR